MTDEQIARKLRLKQSESSALRDMLHQLVREGELLCDSSYRFGMAQQFGAKRGTISGNERGFAFFMPEDGSGDLFIPHRALKGALHGDTVLAINVKGRSGDEGEILAILEHGIKEVVGTFRLDRKAGYLRSDEKKYSEEVYIPFNKTKHCKNGDKAIARITSYARDGSPAGEIIEILGESGDFFVEELSLIRAHGLREEFPAEVITEAEQKAARGITDNDLSGRLDLRNELIITVDGEDTRDIDDAISISYDGNFYRLGVHIADVSNYVARGGVIDNEAYARGTSVYFPDRVLPMLPPALSNDICSLNEGVDRLTLSCLMTVDKQGVVIEKNIMPSVIRSRRRMTYKAITKIYEQDSETIEQYPDLVNFVQTAVSLTKILQNARANRGGVAMDLKEAKILYSNGEISIPDYERTISHEMIEQFMVLANESVATLMTAKKMPFVYRVHEQPSAEKAGDFSAFLGEAGINTEFDPENVSPMDYKKLLESLKDTAIYPLVNRIMLRSMMKAKYSPENLGHFGLASDCYCHFTSPIRRYPDLCIHRIIKESIKNADKARSVYTNIVSSVSEQSSKCEKNATEAERDVDALYISVYMQDKIGEEYDAIISGVTAFGIFAELANTVEGLIPIDTLPDDYYDFDETSYTLRGTRNTFRLGEKLRVRVDGVDFGMRRTHFGFLKKLS